MTGLLVRAISDLHIVFSQPIVATQLTNFFSSIVSVLSDMLLEMDRSYLGHSGLALEPPPDAVVNTLGLPP